MLLMWLLLFKGSKSIWTERRFLSKTSKIMSIFFWKDTKMKPVLKSNASTKRVAKGMHDFCYVQVVPSINRSIFKIFCRSDRCAIFLYMTNFRYFEKATKTLFWYTVQSLSQIKQTWFFTFFLFHNPPKL